MYTIPYALYGVHNTLWKCTQYTTIQYTIYSIHYIAYTIYSTHYTSIYYIAYTLYSIHYIAYTLHYTLYKCAIYSLYTTLYTIQVCTI